jgi:hypothetical protein
MLRSCRTSMKSMLHLWGFPMSEKSTSDNQLDLSSQAIMRQQVEMALWLAEEMIAQYNRYKRYLESALNDFLSETELARVSGLQSELRSLISNFESGAEGLDHDPEFRPRLSRRMLEISRELEKLSRKSRITDPKRPSPNLLVYNSIEALSSDEYEKLTAWEAISLFPRTVVTIVLVTIGFYVARFAPLVKQALASEPGNPFTQAIVVAIYVFLALIVIVVLGLTYAAIFAKSKNALQMLGHFISLLAGSFPGFLAKLGTGPG